MRRKATGPDGIPIKMREELNDETLELIRKNSTYCGTENIPDEHLQAWVIMICKKKQINLKKNKKLLI